MYSLIRHTRFLLIALVALVFSAGLAFGATPPEAAPGLTTAAEHAGKTVPVAGGLQETGEDEESDEDEDADEDEETDEDEDADEDEETDEDEDADEDEDTDEDLDEDVEAEEDGAENCTDPALATPEELEAMNHGATVCWAAHQTEWPGWFSNHGAFVRCWAHQGKADAASCTEDPNAEVPVTEVPEDTAPTLEESKGKSTAKGSHGKGNGKAKGKTKHQD